MEESKNYLSDGLGVDEEAKSDFKDVARWAFINAVVSLVTLVISFISVVAVMRSVGGGTASSSLFGFLIGAVISLLLNITLLQVASNLKKGIETSDQGYFGLGLNKLAAYFKITGIIFIVALAIFILALLFVLVIGAGSGRM